MGTTRDDHPEPRRRHVEPFGDILANQDTLQPLAAGWNLRLNHNLHPLEMIGKALARTRCTRVLRRPRGLGELRPDRRHAGCDLVEHRCVLLFAQRIGAQPFGAATEAAPFQNLDRRRQPRNALVSGFGHLRRDNLCGKRIASP